MPVPVLKPDLTPEPVVQTTGPLATALGGPVGDLHQTLHERLGADQATARLLMPDPLPLDEQLVQAVSRVAGPVLLIAGLVGVAALIF